MSRYSFLKRTIHKYCEAEEFKRAKAQIKKPTQNINLKKTITEFYSHLDPVLYCAVQNEPLAADSEVQQQNLLARDQKRLRPVYHRLY